MRSYGYYQCGVLTAKNVRHPYWLFCSFCFPYTHLLQKITSAVNGASHIRFVFMAGLLPVVMLERQLYPLRFLAVVIYGRLHIYAFAS